MKFLHNFATEEQENSTQIMKTGSVAGAVFSTSGAVFSTSGAVFSISAMLRCRLCRFGADFGVDSGADSEASVVDSVQVGPRQNSVQLQW
jgi:hypothetical protein